MSRAEVVEIDVRELVYDKETCDRPSRRVVVHLVALEKPWLYTLKTGEEVSYPKMGGGMAVHKLHPEKLRLIPLCTEVTGRVLPFHEGAVENRGSRNVKEADCPDCRVALDRAIEQGRVREKKSESGVFRGTLEFVE